MSDLKALFHLRALPHAALALAAVGSTGGALAQTGNATAGGLLYVTPVTFPVSGLLNCENCHSTGPLFRMTRFPTATEATVLSRINTAIGGNSGGMTVYSTLTPQQRADIAAFIVSGNAAPPRPPLAPPPGTPTVPAPPTAPAPPTVVPGPVMFNSTPVGSTSAAVGILLTNGASAVTFGAVTLDGGDATDFLIAAPPAGTTACPAAGGTLDAGMSCSLGALFRPSAAGARTATWKVNFANGVAARTLTLTGTATAASAPAPAPAPTPAPSAANAPTDGGGGAFGWLTLFGLMGFLACGTLRPRRETDAWPHSDS